MNKVVDRFNKLLNVSLLFVVLDVVLGIMLLKFTEASFKIIMVLLGCFILVNGLFSLIRYFYDGLANRIFKADLVTGVAGVVIGIYSMFSPYNSLKIIGTVFAIWILIVGLIKGYYTIELMKNDDEVYPLFAFIALLDILMGIVTLINPFKTFMIISKAVAIFIICYSLVEGVYISLLKRRGKQVLKMFE
jgi:uncharacterized membrane protein HdeD (DUF308 family)